MVMVVESAGHPTRRPSPGMSTQRSNHGTGRPVIDLENASLPADHEYAVGLSIYVHCAAMDSYPGGRYKAVVIQGWQLQVHRRHKKTKRGVVRRGRVVPKRIRE